MYLNQHKCLNMYKHKTGAQKRKEKKNAMQIAERASKHCSKWYQNRRNLKAIFHNLKYAIQL